MNKAILLLGSSGSGKTPVGDHIANTGLWGRRCVHFDFGASLREFGAVDEATGPLTSVEADTVRSSVRNGTLLRDEDFPIAEKLLRRFMDEHGVTADDLVILNGLPRHVGQADQLKHLIQMIGVVELSCTAEVAWERIRQNLGGDRVDRADDSIAEVQKRQHRFRKHTLPLLDFYRAAGIPICTVHTDLETTVESVLSVLADLDWMP